jgi:protein involved in polysaccharide export with SLBB domain
VIVSVKEYNSKRVTVLGEVTQAGQLSAHHGHDLGAGHQRRGRAQRHRQRRSRESDAQRQGLRDYGRDQLRLDHLRKSPDIPLQAGDQIFVNERVF